MLPTLGRSGNDLYTISDVALVEAELNRRPRRISSWDSPADRMATLLETPSVLRR
jgi:IS30 family transposase